MMLRQMTSCNLGTYRLKLFAALIVVGVFVTLCHVKLYKKQTSMERNGVTNLLRPPNSFGLPKHLLQKTKQYTSVKLVDIYRYLPSTLLHYTVVNVGAGDGCIIRGKHCDELNECLIPGAMKRPVKGFLYEITAKRWQSLFKKTFPNFTLKADPLDSSNIAHIFQRDSVPRNIDILKYDTDASDCDAVLAALDAGWTPLIVFMEYNLLFPPPILFNFPFSSGLFQWGKHLPHFNQLGNQCSLQYITDHMGARGYVLVQIGPDVWDVTFMKRSVFQTTFPSLNEESAMYHWKYGYAMKNDRVNLINTTAFQESLKMAPEFWLSKVLANDVDKNAMLSDFYNFCVREKAVQALKGGVQPFFLQLHPKKKDFVYLIQSSKPRLEPRLRSNERRDVLFLCPVNGCDVSQVPPTDVRVRAGLSWTAGRNSLLNDAVERAAVMPNGGYEYYIFLDEDIMDMVVGAAPWEEFEAWLTDTQPAIGYLTKSASFHTNPVKGAPFNVDANVNAFHRTTLGTALPYDARLNFWL